MDNKKLKEIDDLIKDYKKKGEKEIIEQILSKINILPLQVNGILIKDNWLPEFVKNLDSDEQYQYLMFIERAIYLEINKKFIRKIQENPKSDERKNIATIEKYFQTISQIIIKEKMDDDNKKYSKFFQEDMSKLIIPKKHTDNHKYDVESLKQFKFQKKAKSFLGIGKASRMRKAELLDEGGFRVESKKKPGKIEYLWKGEVVFRFEFQNENGEEFDKQMNNQEIEVNNKKAQQDDLKRKDSKAKKKENTLKWEIKECKRRVLIKKSEESEDCFYVYLPRDNAEKVIYFLIFKRAERIFNQKKLVRQLIEKKQIKTQNDQKEETPKNQIEQEKSLNGSQKEINNGSKKEINLNEQIKEITLKDQKVDQENNYLLIEKDYSLKQLFSDCIKNFKIKFIQSWYNQYMSPATKQLQIKKNSVGQSTFQEQPLVQMKSFNQGITSTISSSNRQNEQPLLNIIEDPNIEEPNFDNIFKRPFKQSSQYNSDSLDVDDRSLKEIDKNYIDLFKKTDTNHLDLSRIQTQKEIQMQESLGFQNDYLIQRNENKQQVLIQDGNKFGKKNQNEDKYSKSQQQQFNQSQNYQINVGEKNLKGEIEQSSAGENIQLSPKVLQILELEIISPDNEHPLQKEFFLKYQYICELSNREYVILLNKDNIIPNQELKQLNTGPEMNTLAEKGITKYVLKDKKPCQFSNVKIKQFSSKKNGMEEIKFEENNFTFEICIKTKEQQNDKEVEREWGSCKLLYNEHLKDYNNSNKKKKNIGRDFWLTCQLKDPQNNNGNTYFAYLHVSVFQNDQNSYYDYLQERIKNQLHLKCPMFDEKVYLPYFNPEQIELAYGLLQVFNCEWNFLDHYKFYQIQTDIPRILHNNNIQADNLKSFSEYQANIRTFYHFMYISETTKLMIQSKLHNQIWVQMENCINGNRNDVEILNDFQAMCKEGIPLQNRFQTWYELSYLIDKIEKSYQSLTNFCQNITNLKDDYAKLKEIYDKEIDIEAAEVKKKLKMIVQNSQDYRILINSIKEKSKKQGINAALKSYGVIIDSNQKDKQDYIFQKREDFYCYIKRISHYHCVHITPHLFLDLSKRLENSFIKETTFERFNQISQIVKDLIFLESLSFDRRVQNLQKGKVEDKDRMVEIKKRKIQRKKYSLEKIGIPMINYHQGLIDIIDKLITLNQTSKISQNLIDFKVILPDVFWTLYCFYRHCLKYYICSKYRAKEIIDDLFILNFCLKLYIRELWEHLDSLYINTDFLFEKAFLSLYSNLFSRELLFRIWDVIFLEISRQQIEISFILIAIAMVILSKLKNALSHANTIEDIIFLIQNYCNFEVNINEFVELIYIWIDKLFLQKDNNQEQFDDDYLQEKIEFQETVMEQFYVKYSVCNSLFRDQYLFQMKNICFQKLYQNYLKMKQDLQIIYEKKQAQDQEIVYHPLYQVLTNNPQIIHLVIHSFSAKLSFNNKITITYDRISKEIFDGYLSFKIDLLKFQLKQILGSIQIRIQDEQKEYFGQINLDNLFYDQAIKLNVLVHEKTQLSGKSAYKPIGYFLEVSVLLQTCNTFNLNYSQTQRVSFDYFKNLGKTITEDQRNMKYVVNQAQVGKGILVYYPSYSNMMFYDELAKSDLNLKLDTCNYNLLTFWKINSTVPLEQALSLIDDLFPQQLKKEEKEQLLRYLVNLDGQFYVLDLFLICILYAQECFTTKASLIFKYLNFFERRRKESDISDITVKSFLVAFYERVQYYFPSHQLIILENFINSKASSQINKVMYEYFKGKENLTSYFRQNIIDKVFEKNLSLNIDLSNPDFLKHLYEILKTCKIIYQGKLIVDYQLKNMKLQKQLKILIDQKNKTCVIDTFNSQINEVICKYNEGSINLKDSLDKNILNQCLERTQMSDKKASSNIDFLKNEELKKLLFQKLQKYQKGKLTFIYQLENQLRSEEYNILIDQQNISTLEQETELSEVTYYFNDKEKLKMLEDYKSLLLEMIEKEKDFNINDIKKILENRLKELKADKNDKNGILVIDYKSKTSRRREEYKFSFDQQGNAKIINFNTQINDIKFTYREGEIKLTYFFQQEIIEQYFQKNLSLQIDFTDKLLKTLYQQVKDYIKGTIIIDYTLKDCSRKEQFKILIDQNRQTCFLEETLSPKINQICYYPQNEKNLDFTDFFSQESFKKFFYSNQILNIDFSNPDLLKYLYLILSKKKQLKKGELVIKYELKNSLIEQKYNIQIDLSNKTCLIDDFSPQKIVKKVILREKNEALIKKLLQQQSNLINFEVYDTYNEVQFIDLLNQMPLAPLLLTIKNIFSETPLALEEKKQDIRNLCRNLNVKLNLDLQINDANQKDINNVFQVRDLLYEQKKEHLMFKDETQCKDYIFLPNINMYTPLSNIISNLIKSFSHNEQRAKTYIKLNQKNISIQQLIKVCKVIKVDKNQLQEIADLNQSLFQIDNQPKILDNQILSVNNKSECFEQIPFEYKLVLSINLEKADQKAKIEFKDKLDLNAKNDQNFKQELIQKAEQIESIEITVPKIFCRYQFQNVEKQPSFFPVLNIESQAEERAEKKENQMLASLQLQPDDKFIVTKDDLRDIFVTKIVNKFVKELK
ncbi:hypothetical protein TTHERM_01041970 (macronuclear) [Tetrahymena thermophila SB210]|uniref:Rab-GAP TBC domain-containing protein n=1 Tax=Tetrahymena thermophila (strain SB210) TaxID=312017 RepID=Q24D88_TETTS|nr:hypothetical protein TTHERM_01041970 [Tetrahymena thermophila SB210]EAS05757.2 hypothetical protein TTHERM_01041970 [Tetrahymena thermophila SB210]|eukprot:XP_001026002.2 hypothetical protein TTHERM_01041970 [Tetrahymena thermophila SB210]